MTQMLRVPEGLKRIAGLLPDVTCSWAGVSANMELHHTCRHCKQSKANRSLRDRSNGSLRDHGHLGTHAHLRITFTDHLGITFIEDGGGEGGGMISTPAQQLQTSLLLYRITK